MSHPWVDGVGRQEFRPAEQTSQKTHFGTWQNPQESSLLTSSKSPRSKRQLCHMFVIHAHLFNGPKSGSIYGTETDQEAGDLTRPYILVRIPNVRKQNEDCDFKSAL